ncbi:MAG: RNA-binding transcriptional accessory protein [Leptospiraceae bacterium]|nr:RNA-binding transcriptional accessory protein [Leptospiraceae bacterium]MCP5494927.1 RNA-binding transcriptional accessory protein [Leptospiraceae bacterium]
MTDNSRHFTLIALELGISVKQVEATVSLLEDDATVPFIARYRKEATGLLDEVAITKIRDRLTQLRELDKRREFILKSIEEQGKLTDDLKAKIEEAETMSVLEDLYLPYKPKRRTKATIAREKGLEPLGEFIFMQGNFDIFQEAEKYINPEKGVETVDDAIAGARDIIAEKVNEDPPARAKMRDLFWREGVYQCKVVEGKEEEGVKYKDYFEWKEPLKDAPSHRILAMRRGEKEMILSLDISPDDENALAILEKQFVKGNDLASEQVSIAVKDAYKRLLKPSMETEIRLKSKQNADTEAIRVFADNLRQLLLAAPMGEKNILAIDPGFRTGCKVVCLNPQGKLLHHTVIFPDRHKETSTEIIQKLCEEYKVDAIAIGNGTASRETDAFVRGIGLDKSIQIVMVNESGASVYSASDVAREEMPDYDITVRGAVSIGRRLMDPLAELVKIDPKSIGVGQYQHDVDQTQLKSTLDDVVMSSVNAVGVEVNTASKQLLTYISGLGPQLAQNIIEYRNQNGAFRSRAELKKVKRLGEKAFEQAAGFLRIRGAENPLDASAVHPETYPIVEQMAKDLGCTIGDLIKNESFRKKIDLKKYVTDAVGIPTLNDILGELAKPGRDPRDTFEVIEFAEGIHKMEDLKVGMQLNGIVTNITKFGAFVDIGVHQDGLIHISQMSTNFIKDPTEVVKVHQKVTVTVTEVDIPRKRIALSMISDLKQKKETQETQTTPKNVQAQKTEKKKQTQKKVTGNDFQSKLNALKNKFGHYS